MEPKFRPIPLTILDFLAVLIPGFIYLLLLITSLRILLDTKVVTSPIDAWQPIAAFARQVDSSLLVLLGLFVAAVVIGFVIKPLAMRCARFLATPWFWVYQWRKWLRGRKPNDSAARFSYSPYPFNEVYEDNGWFKKVEHQLQTTLELQDNPRCFPGFQPFNTAKRYLRQAAPTLWEECERMEAEVRMIGALFIAAFLSLGLSILALVSASGTPTLFSVFHFIPTILTISHFIPAWFKAFSEHSSIVCWLFLSVGLIAVIGEGYAYSVIRELEYTYINTLIAFGCSSPNGSQDNKRSPSASPPSSDSGES